MVFIFSLSGHSLFLNLRLMLSGTLVLSFWEDWLQHPYISLTDMPKQTPGTVLRTILVTLISTSPEKIEWKGIIF